MIETPPQVTKITYKKACEILGVSLDTLNQAIGRGMLTRLPRQGLERHLIEQQVRLFVGKNISFTALSDAEIATWKKYDETVAGKAQPQTEREVFIADESLKKLADMFSDMLAEKLLQKEPGRVNSVSPFR